MSATVAPPQTLERARAASNPWFRLLLRVGLVSRGVVYCLLAYFAVDIARHGSAPEPASGEGALRDIAQQPAGPAMLALLSVGLVGYALWRAVQVIRGEPGEKGTSVVKRLGFLVSGAVYLTLFVEAILLIAGSRGGGTASSHPQSLVAEALRWPAGPELVGLGATVVLAGGAGLAIWSWVHDFDRTLEVGRMSRRLRLAAKLSATVGDVTRGVLIVLIGVYLMEGAVTDDPAKAKSLGQVLKVIASKPLGVWALGLAAVGLLCFAAFSGIEAVYRRM